jgi:hypothetical protein
MKAHLFWYDDLRFPVYNSNEDYFPFESAKHILHGQSSWCKRSSRDFENDPTTGFLWLDFPDEGDHPQ